MMQVRLERDEALVVQVVDEDEQVFHQAWQDDALFMKLQPGFISTQLYRGIGEIGAA